MKTMEKLISVSLFFVKSNLALTVSWSLSLKEALAEIMKRYCVVI